MLPTCRRTGSSLLGRSGTENVGSTVPAFKYFLMVFRDRPVGRAISRTATFSRRAKRRMTFNIPMSITPVPPVAQGAGGRVTWVNSQGKKAAFLGQCRVEIHSTADDIPDKHLVRWSMQEIRRIASRMAQRQIQPASIVASSIWRRAHKAVAKCAHNKEIWNRNAKIIVII